MHLKFERLIEQIVDATLICQSLPGPDREQNSSKMVKLVVSGKDNNEDVKRWEKRESERRLDGGQGRQIADADRDKRMIQGRAISIDIINLTTQFMLRQCFEEKQTIHQTAYGVLLLFN